MLFCKIICNMKISILTASAASLLGSLAPQPATAGGGSDWILLSESEVMVLLTNSRLKGKMERGPYTVHFGSVSGCRKLTAGGGRKKFGYMVFGDDRTNPLFRSAVLTIMWAWNAMERSSAGQLMVLSSSGRS